MACREVVKPPSHRNNAADRATSPRVSPCALCQSRAQRLPSIISKQYASKRHEGSNHDRRRRGTGCAFGFPPCCQVEHHCWGVAPVAPSERQVVRFAQVVASIDFLPSFNLLAVARSSIDRSNGCCRIRGRQIRPRDEGSHWANGAKA